MKLIRRLLRVETTISLITLCLVTIDLFAQEPNYLRDLKPEDVERIIKSSEIKDSKSVERPDSLISRTYAAEEADKIFFVNREGFPSTKEGRYIYIVDGQERNSLRTGLFKFSAIDTEQFGKWTLVKEMTYLNDTLSGPFKYYYENGPVAKKGKYLSGKSDGEAIVYYPGGQVYRQYSYVKGEIDGVMKEFYNDGNTKMIMEIKMGAPHGVYRTFYPDTKLEEEWNYVNGKASGTYKYFHPNGQLWVEKEYMNDLLVNVIVNYDSAGKIKDKGTLKNGDGTVKCYDDKGKLYMIEHFKGGLKTHEESFR